MELLGSYINGNYKVSIFNDGTKIRENDLDNLTPDTYESMDVKVTNSCDRGCKFCHENSVPNGKSARLQDMTRFVEGLHSYTELAIGGGNPLEYPNLETMLRLCKKKDVIPSMTVNQIHFIENFDRIKYFVDNELVYGLGVSLVEANDEFIEKVKQFPNAVIHTINGVVTKRDLIRLKDNNFKLLILGYKEFRRGVSYKTNNKISLMIRKQFLYDLLPTMIEEEWFKTVSFDNLALKQLDVKSILSNDQWNEFYMGDDGQYTFFVDLVEGLYAKNSCEPYERRYQIGDNNAQEMFNYLKEN